MNFITTHNKDTIMFNLQECIKRTNPYKTIVSEIETAIIAKALSETNGNFTHAAQKLGINRNTLRSKMKEYGLK